MGGYRLTENIKKVFRVREHLCLWCYNPMVLALKGQFGCFFHELAMCLQVLIEEYKTKLLLV